MPVKEAVVEAKSRLESKLPSNVAAYVKSKGGTTPISRVLIANNGIAAVKAMKSMHKWAYETFGNDREIEFIAMATPEDTAANAEYIRLADQCVTVPGGSNNNNYANIMLITDLAERVGAHAVWAGWGHASENPKLPDALAKTETGVVWIGPPASAMRALGDKIGSTLIAQSSGVSCMSWSGDGLTIDYEKEGIPEDKYLQSCVRTSAEALEVCEKIGFPVMIKASEGGGGKGIRKVLTADEVPTAFGQVQGEIPGSPIFIMKLSSECRHLEVQLLGDATGNAIALAGRDCSIQRRHQKIIEEGPVLSATPEEWKTMEDAAVALAKAVNYVGAGTVEYLYTPSGEYYFLELNPRLQVEHPVTELITGVNLPAAQLQVAMGIPLAGIPEVRRLYGKKMEETSPIDFINTPQILNPGHVIACRITAENPDSKFTPTSGKIRELNFRSSPNVWGYFSVKGEGGVHEYSDSQFGHIFAFGETREVARSNMTLALKGLSIRGDIRTTVEYLAMILENKEFRDNQVSTTWLEKVMAQEDTKMVKPDDYIAVLLGTIYRSFQYASEKLEEYMNALGRGAMPSGQLHQELISQTQELIYNNIKYSFNVSKSGPDSFDITLLENDAAWGCTATATRLADDGLLVLLNGQKFIIFGQEFPAGLRLVIDGKTCLFRKEYDPTTLKSAMQGKLVRYMVEDGAHVNKGDAFCEVEVMKMYLSLNAPESGTISLANVGGAIIEAGSLLAHLKLDHPDMVRTADNFTGTFPKMGAAALLGNNTTDLLADSVKKLVMLLNGYKLGDGVVDETLARVVSYLRDPSLPYDEFQGVFSTLSGRIPEPLYVKLYAIAGDYQKSMAKNRFYWENPDKFPVAAIDLAIEQQALKLTEVEVAAMNTTLEASGMLQFLKNHKNGNHTFAAMTLEAIMQEFFLVEEHFSANAHLAPEDVIKILKKNAGLTLAEVATIARGNHQLKERAELVVKIIDTILTDLKPMMGQFIPMAHKLANLVGQSEYASVVLKCRQLITEHEMPTSSQRQISLQTFLKSAAEAKNSEQKVARLAPLIDQSRPIEDMVFQFFDITKPAISAAAFEGYVRRMYHMYSVKDLDVAATDAGFLCKWSFFLDEASADIDLVRNAHYDADTASKMSRVTSLADLSRGDYSGAAVATANGGDSKRTEVFRQGAMVYYKDYAALKTNIKSAITDNFTQPTVAGPALNVLYLALKWEEGLPTDAELAEFFISLLKANEITLYDYLIRRVTFVVSAEKDSYPLYFTFRSKNNFAEDIMIRHIEPSYAIYLELQKLDNFDIQFVPTENRTVHLFSGTPTADWKPSNKRDKYNGKRLFARTLVRNLESVASHSQSTDFNELDFDAHPELEYAFVESLNSLEMAIECRYDEFRYNHMFVNILVPSAMDVAYVTSCIRLLTRRYATKIRRLRVTDLELYCRFATDNGEKLYHFICSNPTMSILNVDVYTEEDGPKGQKVLKVLGANTHVDKYYDYYWDKKPIFTPYPSSDTFRVRREIAAATGTTYAYDFILLFEKAVEKYWYKHNLSAVAAKNTANKPQRRPRSLSESKVSAPKKLVSVKELILGEDGKSVKEVERAPGLNDIGMVAWKITLQTPECPAGRDIVVIANDISFQMGTFGTKEDDLFAGASAYAREHEIPRYYMAANSGARIGLANEVKCNFQVAWINDDPFKGMEYLYLNAADYAANTKSVIATKITTASGEERYVLTDIIGIKGDLGVENLSASGHIAGETSQAYKDIFTLTYITGRCVGIGAYLARLGQRVIQKRGEPILLTGFNALNKLLGKRVYRSNNQLGGIDIMYNNGISHMTVTNDLAGVSQCLKWLSYLPEKRHAPVPILNTGDPVDRLVEFMPKKGLPYDPRALLIGQQETVLPQDGGDSSAKFVSGFFDKGSFMEVMGGWSKGIVTGRARLGGIPMGVISVDTNTTECVVPADPAAPESKEEILPRAAQVWYPDSSYKTAQAMWDLAAEDLPVIIFANWRGFSGGQRDMFNEVLKFGSYIVDALRDIKQPVFVYLPPFSTLRGGAWVVVDSKINPDFVQMYACPSARGGVLEPEGILDVKFRKQAVINTAHRLDSTLIKLDADVKAATPDSDAHKALVQSVKDRETSVYPLYHQAAAAFVDLHDTPGRMKAKNVIEQCIPWAQSREFFYWRLKRRLAEDAIAAQLTTDGETSLPEARALVWGWSGLSTEEVKDGDLTANDKAFLSWLSESQSSVNNKVAAHTRNAKLQSMKALMEHGLANNVDVLIDLLSTLSAEQVAQISAAAAAKRG